MIIKSNIAGSSVNGFSRPILRNMPQINGGFSPRKKLLPICNLKRGDLIKVIGINSISHNNLISACNSNLQWIDKKHDYFKIPKLNGLIKELRQLFNGDVIAHVSIGGLLIKINSKYIEKI